MCSRPQVIAFDIIETVFSLERMRDRLRSLGLPGSALEAWFAAALRDAFALAVTDRFAPFRSMLEGALANVLAKNRLPFDEQKVSSVLDGMWSLEPQPDATECFGILINEGFRIVALSNGATTSTNALLKGAGLDAMVERVFSVEDVKLSKPRREIYLHTAEALGVRPAEVALVATHAWDTHGAKSAGLMTGFVARGQPYPSVMLPPDVQGQELKDVAELLAALA